MVMLTATLSHGTITAQAPRLPLLTSTLLILLFGKYCEYSNDRSELHISNSQTFLPRSSNSGREQKSNSQTSLVGTLFFKTACS
jgi:hypothetical protein